MILLERIKVGGNGDSATHITIYTKGYVLNKIYIKLLEDSIPTNNVGQGNIAAIGVGPQGEPGFPNMKKKKKLKDIIIKRTIPPSM